MPALLRHLVLAALVVSTLAAAKAPGIEANATLLFIGGSDGDGRTPTLANLEERLKSADPASTIVVFTGNYTGGEFPHRDDLLRARAESAAMAHVTATLDFYQRGGRVFYLVGDHDFPDEAGTKPVRRLRKFLNEAYAAAAVKGDDENQEAVDVMPNPACGTPKLLELTDELGLLLVNSQWWMIDRNGDKDFNEHCDGTTRASFTGHFLDNFRKYRNTRLIIASHHPMRSYGPLGGSFTAGAHASPLPIVGTAWVFARWMGLVEQYEAHPMFHAYTEFLRTEGNRNGAYVFVSGHDASLQYLELQAQTQIVAGTSGNEATPVVGASDGDFSLSSPGWAEITVEHSGRGKVELVSSANEKVFEKPLLLHKVLAQPPSDLPAPMPQGPVMATYSKKHVWQFPGFVTLFLGDYYAESYALKMPYPVLDLRTELGGLTPEKIGGGAQTNSIRVKDGSGNDYSIRAVTKDTTRLLPYPMNQISFVGRLLDHGFTATHPEAALALPWLAKAVDVRHPTPRMMYLPDQEALGQYRGFITNEVVMLEQRPKQPDEGTMPENLVGPDDKENKTKFKDHDEFAEKRLDHPEKHRLDTDAMVRARLLDMFVGDWDRHRGQWDFAVATNADGNKLYTPIPLDRDQAFARYDGLSLVIARLLVPPARSLQPFNGSYGRIGWLNYNARDFDALHLSSVPYERFMAQAQVVQKALTDEVIEAAFKDWHKEAFEVEGDHLVASLKLRRDKLLEAAEDFYKLLARNVDVVGSRHPDRFDVYFADSGTVRVTVGTEKNETYYDRTFLPDETKELHLYALEGDDALLVHGRPHSKIDIKFVGGTGQDSLSAANRKEHLKASAIEWYDSVNGGTVDPSLEVDDERSARSELNQYEERENHEPDYGMFMPGLLINPDDGVYLGGKFTYITQGWKRVPFAARHDLTAYFATATLGANFAYHGLFPQSFDLLDQDVDLIATTPTYTRNFYGYTNQWTDDSLNPPDYYRVRQARYEGRYGLSYGFGSDRSRVGAQLVVQAIDTLNTAGRFAGMSPDVSDDDFGFRFFGGARVFAETNTFDSLTLPRRGVALHASINARYDLQKGKQFSTTYKVAAATAIPLDRNQRFVILTRASVEGIVGDHPFYFAPTVGDSQLRGYRRDQLAGDVAFAHTTDLRIDVVRLYSGLPGTIGINLSADHGRVFGAGVSDQYHLNFGGGVWWSIVDLIGISLNYHRGLDGGERISVAAGPLFNATGF